MEKVLYRIKVKKYMTEKASYNFDFMEKYNNNEPMPLRIMFGEITKETKGMVFKKKLVIFAFIPKNYCSLCITNIFILLNIRKEWCEIIDSKTT